MWAALPRRATGHFSFEACKTLHWLSARLFFTPRGWRVACLHDTRHHTVRLLRCQNAHRPFGSGLPECIRFLHRPRPIRSRRWVYVPMPRLLALVRLQTNLLALLQHPSLVSGQGIYFTVGVLACTHYVMIYIRLQGTCMHGIQAHASIWRLE